MIKSTHRSEHFFLKTVQQYYEARVHVVSGRDN